MRAVARQLNDAHINRRPARDPLARQLARLSPVSSFADAATDRRAPERTGMWLASLSPYGSFLHAVTALSDTGLEADDRFHGQAHLYDRQQEVKTITSAERHKPGLASSFTFEATPLRERFSAAAPPTLILILYNLGWLIASTLAFRRTDVR